MSEVLFHYDFADGQVPPELTVENPSLVSVVAAPSGGPGGNALKIENVQTAWTYVDYGVLYAEFNYWTFRSYHSVSRSLPVSTSNWMTLEFWMYAETDQISNPNFDSGDDWANAGTSAGVERYRSPLTGRNSTWVNSGYDWWGPGSSEVDYRQSGWVYRTINISISENPHQLHLSNDAWADYYYHRNGVSEFPPSSLENFTGAVYFADVKLTSLPSTTRFTDWRLGLSTADDAYYPFVWVNEWSPWQEGIIRNEWHGPSPKYLSRQTSRAERADDTGGFPDLPFDEGKAAEQWELARSGDAPADSQDQGWGSEPFWGTGYFNMTLDTYASWGYASGLSQQFSYHRARAGQHVRMADLVFAEKFLIQSHQDLFNSVGVTWSTAAGAADASPIPTELRDPTDTREMVVGSVGSVSGTHRSATHRQFISYKYEEDNQVLDVKLRVDSTPTATWYSNEYPPPTPMHVKLCHITQPLSLGGMSIDDGSSSPGLAPWLPAGSSFYSVALGHADFSWFTVIDKFVDYPGLPFNDPTGRRPLTPDRRFWIYAYQSVNDLAWSGAFGTVGDRGDRPSGTISDGEEHRLGFPLRFAADVKTRPWRYWISYETDVPYGLVPCPPHLRLVQRQDRALGMPGNQIAGPECNKAVRLIGRGEVDQNLTPGKSPRVYLPNSYF